jgi:CrcB protein
VKALEYLWIAIGGALGSMARYWFSGVVSRHFGRLGETFPLGTLLVNISGSFAIGLLAAFADPGGRRFIGPNGRLFLMYGICGGYTTFSSFSLQTLELIRDGDWFKATINTVASVALCLAGVWLGYALGLGLNSNSR